MPSTSLQNVLKPTRDKNLWSLQIKLDYLTQLRQDPLGFICHMSDEIISSRRSDRQQSEPINTPLLSLPSSSL